MIPVIIEDYIKKLSEKSTHPDRRQFYFDTLKRIRDAINISLNEYEKERQFRK
jgi:hypothetical protein